MANLILYEKLDSSFLKAYGPRLEIAKNGEPHFV